MCLRALPRPCDAPCIGFRSRLLGRVEASEMMPWVQSASHWQTVLPIPMCIYIYIYWILGCSGHEPNMRFSHGDSHDFIWQRCLFSRLQMGRWAGQQTATIGPIGEVCAANADGTLPLAKWFLQEPIKRIGILSDFLALKFIKVLQCLFEWDLFCYQTLDPKFPCSLLGTIHDHPW